MTIAPATAAGEHTFKVIAGNGADPDAEQVFTLTVMVAPVMTSANNTSLAYGAGGTFTVTVTGGAAITYSLTGQPAGVTINTSTGVITIASTTAAGAHTFTVTASDGVTPNATQPFTLTVTAPPSITSANNINVTGGTGGTFTVTSTGHPAIIYSLTDEPEGVTINASTGVITIASSTAVGEHTFTVKASNSVADHTQTFTLKVTEGSGNNSTLWIVLIIILIIAAGGIAYYMYTKKGKP